MTTKEMRQAIEGKRFLRVPSGSRKESIWVEVEVLDMRYQFGRLDVQVRPVAGSGSMWVVVDNLSEEAQK